MDERLPTGSARTISMGVRVAPVLVQGMWITVLLALVGTGARLTIPILVQQVIDRGLTGPVVDIALIGRLALVGAAVTLVSAVCLRAAALRLGTRAERGLSELRVRLFTHIHRLSLEAHNEERRGVLVSRVTNDIETMTQFFAWGGLTLLLDGTQIVAVSAVMIAYDWRLAMIAFVVSTPLILVLRAVQVRLLVAHERSRETNGVALGLLSETIAGADTLRVYSAVEPRVGRVRASLRERSRANVRAGILGALLFPSGEVFAVFTVTSVVGLGIWLGPGAGLTAGAVTGFLFLTFRFLEPIAEFTEMIDTTQSAVASLRRVLTVLDMPVGPPPAERPTSMPAGGLTIELRDVDFAYGSRLGGGEVTPVLRGVQLVVPPGQHAALVGPSGSGKTTIARLIARFADPTSGSVRLGGVDVREVDDRELRRRLVVVPQEPFLFSGSIRGNLLFAVPDATEDAILRSVMDLGLDEWLEGMDDGLDTEVGERGGHLSAGERQIVALLRAGLVQPDVLVLDEATSSVDASMEVRIARAFERLSAGRTTVSIAHRLSTAMRADRVVVVVDGRIVEDGTHDELVAAGERYAEMYAAWVEATAVGS